MRRPLYTLALFALIVCDACLHARTRDVEDRADSRRRCLLADTFTSREVQAVRCAEWFIARQGYTLAPPVEDTTLIVPEGIEWSASVRERLAGRHGSLQPRAFGVCVRPEGGFDVMFRYASGEGARGVSLDERFGSLRVVHADFNSNAVTQRLYGCRPLANGEAQ